LNEYLYKKAFIGMCVQKGKREGMQRMRWWKEGDEEEDEEGAEEEKYEGE